MRKLKYNKNIYINYIYLTTKGIDATQGIWVLYLLSKGMSLFEVGLLEGIFHLTSFLMETPTGVVADIFSRKASRLIGVCFAVLSSIMMIISSNFIFFALAFVFAALSYNFESGAGEAMVYDTLAVDKQEKKFIKITSTMEIIYQTTSIVALIIGGIVGNIQYRYVYYIAIAIGIITFIIGTFFREIRIEPKAKKQKLANAMKSQYVNSFKAIKGNSRLAYIIVVVNVVAASLTLSFYYLQSAWERASLSVLHIGVYLAISAVFGAIGATFAERIDKKLGEDLILKLAPIIFAISIMSFYFLDFAIILFCLVTAVDSILFVATRYYINKRIESDKRATILSFDSAVFSLVMILIFPLFGYVADTLTIPRSFLILGGVLLIMGLINIIVTSASKANKSNTDTDI